MLLQKLVPQSLIYKPVPMAALTCVQGTALEDDDESQFVGLFQYAHLLRSTLKQARKAARRHKEQATGCAYLDAHTSQELSRGSTSA